MAAYCPTCNRVIVQSASGQCPKCARRIGGAAPVWRCTRCGVSGSGSLPGSGWIELALWVLVLMVGGLIYSIWRRTAAPVCSACGGTLVPADSPAARTLPGGARERG